MVFKKGKIIKYSVLASIVGLVVIYSTYSMLRTEPITYMTVTPKVGDIVKQVYATGTLSGKISVDVGAQVSGQIKRLYVNNGDKVKAGDLLCEIDPDIQTNQLRSSQAEEMLIKAQIRSKEAQIDMLKAEHLRQQKLIKIEATSEQLAEQAKAQYLMAQADLDALKAQYDKALIAVDDAKTKLGYTKITAPMDGTVYAIPVEEGQTVNANQTTPTILKLANLDVMTVEAEISEADVVKVAPGMECEFTIMGLPQKTFKAVLRSIDPAPASAQKSDSTTSTNDQAVYYNALLDVDNPDGILRIDMTAEVSIITAKAQNVLHVPLAALQNENLRKGTATISVLQSDNTLKEYVVKLGVKDEQNVEIIDPPFDTKANLVLGDSTFTSTLSNKKGAGPRPPVRM